MDELTGRCCDNGYFGILHACQKQPGPVALEPPMPVYIPVINGAGVPRSKLSNRGTGAAMHADKHKLNAKRPSSIARAFRKAGLDWQTDFAVAIKNKDTKRIKLWLRLLPYLVTTTRLVKTKRWKGKASKAAMIALEALERK